MNETVLHFDDYQIRQALWDVKTSVDGVAEELGVTNSLLRELIDRQLGKKETPVKITRKFTVEDIAQICHEANRITCEFRRYI